MRFALLILLLALCSSSCFQRFPTRDQVRSSLQEIERTPAGVKRFELTKTLLAKLRDPQSATDDEVVQLALTDLRDLYLRLRDDFVLQEIDSTDIDGGFANFVCSLYRDLMEASALPSRYANDAASANRLHKCIGISFSREELDRTLGRR